MSGKEQRLHDPASKSYSGDFAQPSASYSGSGSLAAPAVPSLSERGGNYVNGLLQKLFGSIGYFCASNPWLTIALVTVFVAGMSVGIIKFEQENREEELWVPRGSIVLEHAGFYASAFAPEARNSKVLLVASETEGAAAPGVNLLEKANLESALQIHLHIFNLQAEAEGKVWNYTTLCEVDKAGNCLTENILSLWNYDPAALQADPNPLGTIQTRTPAEKINVWLGGVAYTPEGLIASATAFRFGYTLANRARIENGGFVDPPANAWEGEFLEYSLNGEHPFYTMYPEAERSFQDEFGGAVNGDIVYLGVSFILIIFYLSLVLGEFSLVRSRVLLSMCGIVSIGYAVSTSFGLSSLCGFKYNYVHSLMPFLLLAVGVDNVFILVNAFEATNPLDSIPDRAAEAMSHAGVSITVTSLTNFTAFVIGTTTSLPALSSFCFYTAMAILFLYIYQVTFLCACVSLDERRILSKRVDCCLCCTGTDPHEHEKIKRGKLNLFMEEYWAKFLLLTPVKIGVVAIAIGLLAFAITGILKLEIQDATSNFIPSGSYIKETGRIEKDYFVTLGTPVDIVTQTIPDYFSNQDALASLRPMHDGNQYMEPSTEPTYKSWYDAYLLWLSTSQYNGQLDQNGRPTTPANFYSWLKEFLATDQGEEFRGDVVYAGNSTTFIRATRIRTSYIPLETPTSQVRAMESLRESCDTITAIPTFPWSFEFITWEQNAVVSKEIYVNLALSLLTIFIISFVLIANPLASLLVLGSVALTVADILGIMHYWGLSVDSVTAVNLVLAVGFSVDYTAHIAHCFMLQTGSRHSRVTACLGDIGISVINGAFSTFLAILVLAFSTSYVFTVFFKQFFLVCLLGVFHGMALLPVVLSWIGPAPYASVQNKAYSPI